MANARSTALLGLQLVKLICWIAKQFSLLDIQVQNDSAKLKQDCLSLNNFDKIHVGTRKHVNV